MFIELLASKYPHNNLSGQKIEYCQHHQNICSYPFPTTIPFITIILASLMLSWHLTLAKLYACLVPLCPFLSTPRYANVIFFVHLFLNAITPSSSVKKPHDSQVSHVFQKNMSDYIPTGSPLPVSKPNPPFLLRLNCSRMSFSYILYVEDCTLPCTKWNLKSYFLRRSLPTWLKLTTWI